MLAALHPPSHPYHWPTIGQVADLHAARVEEVRDFFARYYHPANASIAIAGDVDTSSALDLVRRYFEDFAPGPAVAPVRPTAPVLQGETRLLIEDRVELPRLYMAWITTEMFAADDAELELAADILANGKTSRLYQELVYEKRIALDVSAFQSSREIGSFFLLAATAAPGQSLAGIAAAMPLSARSASTAWPACASGVTTDSMPGAPGPNDSTTWL